MMEESQWVYSFVQSGRCRDTEWLPQGSKLPSSCLICGGWSAYSEDESCRFQDFRLLRHTSTGVLELAGFDEGSIQPAASLYPKVFEKNPQEVEIRELQSLIAKALEPVLVEELDVLELYSPCVVFKYLEKEFVACDLCNTSILFGSFFCSICAQEMCIYCYKEAKHLQEDEEYVSTQAYVKCAHDMHACSRIQRAELQAILQSVREVPAWDQPQKPPTAFMTECQLDAERYGSIPLLHLTHKEPFLHLWQIPLPLSVEPVQGATYDRYSPDNLDMLHGTKEIRATKYYRRSHNDSGRSKSKAMSVRQFLQICSSARLKTDHVVRIEELPQNKTLAESWPLEYPHFLIMAPFASHTSPIGFYNLASHYAINQYDRSAHKPDLGPKVQLSASIRKTGSLTLRMNIASTFYVLAHLDKSPNSWPSWLVFRREDTVPLRKFLNNKFPCAESDIIHGRQYYISDTDLVHLRDRGVRPYSITQKPGWSILIPAGCPHQVQTEGIVVHIVNQFVDCYSIPAGMQLTAEWRQYGERDTVQMKWLLWHAWHSLAQLASTMKSVVDVEAREATSTRKSRKNAKRRQTVGARDVKALNTHKASIAQGKMTEQEYAQSHVYHCPHLACLGSRRPFTGSSVFDHLSSRHKVHLGVPDRLMLLEKPQAEWQSAFITIMAKQRFYSDYAGPQAVPM
ncbi:hypothetical protein BC835DRAFT_726182 [Cytidiella melzeri]|nr:hypothetical protein BC835DRAFT_726182 [Cytidiella melzeri]